MPRFPLALVVLCVTLICNSNGVTTANAYISPQDIQGAIAEEKWEKCLNGLSQHVGRRDQNLLVIGHAYGAPGSSHLGLDPKLARAIPGLSRRFENVGLTGDIVSMPSRDSLYKAKEQLGAFNRVIAAPGNHDIGQTSQNFERVFGPLYGYTRVGESAIIWLDSASGDQAVSTQQMKWLRKTLHSPIIRNSKSLVVLIHHMVWAATPDELAAKNAGPADPSWQRNSSRLTRVLRSGYPRSILVVSGDTGAFAENSATVCRSSGRLTLLANGIGGRSDDAVLIITTGASPSVQSCTISSLIADYCRRP